MNYLIVKVPSILRYLTVWYLRRVRYPHNSSYSLINTLKLKKKFKFANSVSKVPGSRVRNEPVRIFHNNVEARLRFLRQKFHGAAVSRYDFMCIDMRVDLPTSQSLQMFFYVTVAMRICHKRCIHEYRRTHRRIKMQTYRGAYLWYVHACRARLMPAAPSCKRCLQTHLSLRARFHGR